MTDRTPDMRRALGKRLRDAFAPVTGSDSAVDAQISALCKRIDGVGGGRRDRPFPDRKH